jgi:hypothetical protein
MENIIKAYKKALEESDYDIDKALLLLDSNNDIKLSDDQKLELARFGYRIMLEAGIPIIAKYGIPF